MPKRLYGVIAIPFFGAFFFFFLEASFPFLEREAKIDKSGSHICPLGCSISQGKS